MDSRLALAMLAASLTVAVRAQPLAAQRRSASVIIPTPLTALALNDLEFSGVLPGIALSVPVTDSRHAGLFDIMGSPGTSVRVEFVLPTALVAPGGALLPVRFGPGDGFAGITRFPPHGGAPFNPLTPLVNTLGAEGHLYIRLGGTAFPSRTQTRGEYRATIYLTVYDVGS